MFIGKIYIMSMVTGDNYKTDYERIFFVFWVEIERWLLRIGDNGNYYII